MIVSSKGHEGRNRKKGGDGGKIKCKLFKVNSRVIRWEDNI